MSIADGPGDRTAGTGSSQQLAGEIRLAVAGAAGLGPPVVRSGRHPAVVPVNLVARLMQSAQERMLRDFPEHLIQAELSRLWPNGAYLGSYGDITSKRVRGYIQRWEAGQGL